MLLQIIIVVSVFLGILYIVATINYLKNRDFDVSFLHPMRNYEEWDDLNWFGVGTVTLFLNVIFLPYSIIHWLSELICFLITVGRKK